ncbi:Alanine--tRNA ligase [Fusarium oxysporum f. sp. albedinis]|nr:Alanine--tRNA ligase [Fusarium oxysporum f. sp. albedinis]
MTLSRNTHQKSSGLQASSSTLCDRTKAADVDRADQSFTETPRDHHPARPHVNQPGSSDSGATGTGKMAESPEHTHGATSNFVIYRNAVAGPGVDQINGACFSFFGTPANSNNIREVHDSPWKEGPGNQHNGPTFVCDVGVPLHFPNWSAEYNNPTMILGASDDGGGKKVVGTQHNGPRYIMRSSARRE